MCAMPTCVCSKFSGAGLNPDKASPTAKSITKPNEDTHEEGEDRDSRRQQQFTTLAGGVATSLRTLVKATFQPASRVEGSAGGKARDGHIMLDALNPTAALLRASLFLASQPKVFELVCLLNANMNAVDLTTQRASSTANSSKGNRSAENEEDVKDESGSKLLGRSKANSILRDLADQALRCHRRH